MTLPRVIRRPVVAPKSKKSADPHKAVRDRGYADYQFFVEYFFPHLFWGRPSGMHRKIIEWEANPARTGCLEVMAAPRGHAKTTWRVTIKAIHAICYGYAKFGVVIGYSRAEANDKVRDIRDELLSNEKLKQVFGELIPPRSGSTAFIANNVDYRTGKPVYTKILARSKGGQVRGLRHRDSRPDLFWLDDIEDLEHTRSPEQRKKTKDWFMKDVMGAGQTDGSTNVFFVGTILHPQGLLADLLKAPGWKRSKFSAVVQWAANRELWAKWEEIYRDLENEAAEADARAFYEKNKKAMDEGVEELWPDGDPFYRVMEYKVKFGTASLYSEKLNEPYDPEAQVLHPENCKRFRVIWPHDADWPQALREYREGFCVQWMDGSNRTVHSDGLKIIAFHDPAMAESKKSDFAAICVCAQDEKGYIYELETWLEKSAYDRQILKAFELQERWGLEALYLEKNGFQGLLSPLFREEQAKRKAAGLPYEITIRPVTQHSDKTARIARLEPYFNNQWILFNEKGNRTLVDQLMIFPTAENDDGPDALEGAVSKLRRPRGTVSFQDGDNAERIS